MAFKKVQLFDKGGNTLYPQANINNIVNDAGEKVSVALSGDLTAKADTNVLAGKDQTGFTSDSTVRGAIDTVAGDVDKLEAVTAGYTGENTIKNAIDAVAGDVDKLELTVNDIIEAGVSYEVVPELPAVSAAKKGTIYLIEDKESLTDNVYKEYILVVEKDEEGTEINRYFQVIGTTATDLSTKADVESPIFKGTVQVPDLTASDSSTTDIAANQKYVDGAAGTAKAEAIAAAASDAAERAKAAKEAAIDTIVDAMTNTSDSLSTQLGQLGAVVYYKVVTE